MEKEIDKGDIIKQKKFKVSPFDTTKSVYRKARIIEPKLIYEVLTEIKNDTFQLKKQNEKFSSEYNILRKPEDSLVDENKSLKELYNFIRSCNYEEYPAFFYVKGQKVLIKLSREKKHDPYNDLI